MLCKQREILLSFKKKLHFLENHQANQNKRNQKDKYLLDFK